jgi:hypothetical protein
MNKLILITAAALLALTSAADAVEMPKDLRGDWCGRGDSGNPNASFYGRFDEGGCNNDEPKMTVTARGLEIVEGNCTAIRVTKFDIYPWGRRVHKNPWGPGYRISFLCINKDNSTNMPAYIQHTWQIEKGILEIIAGSR